MIKNFLFCILIILLSCGNSNESRAINFSSSQNFSNSETDKISFEIPRNRDVVDNLFNQAMKNDKELRALNNRIIEIDKITAKTYVDYYKYKSYNDKYYESADRYLSTVRDSSIQKRLKNILEESENNFATKIKDYRILERRTMDLDRKLKDLQVAMKLIITENLIKKQQVNIPNKEKIEKTIADYKELIEEAEKMIKE